MQEEVILVNENDEQMALMEKLEAHQKGLLHRAFSVFIFNSKNELLLQQRALSKYHSAGLWTNTCCSHPRNGEETLAAAKRRLKEEMGIDCKIEFKSTFIYKADFDNGLIEHELDHIFTGTFSGEPITNPDEVEAYQWLSIDEIKKQMIAKPNNYTAWFKIAIEKFF